MRFVKKREEVVKFPVTKSLWDLWDLLEKHGVKSVYYDLFTPSEDPFYVEIRVIGDEAELRLPEPALKMEEVVDLVELFAEAYTGHHAEWEKVVRGDYEAWIEHLKRTWIEHGMAPEEAEKKKQEIMKTLEEDIKREARRLKAYSAFAKSLFELLYPKKRR